MRVPKTYGIRRHGRRAGCGACGSVKSLSAWRSPSAVRPRASTFSSCCSGATARRTQLTQSNLRSADGVVEQPCIPRGRTSLA